MGARSMNANGGRSMAAATVLAVGIVLAAWVISLEFKHIGGSRHSISVKGLAEKPVQADRAEWTVTTEVVGPTFADALAKLRSEQPKLRAFLQQQGFTAAVV